MESEQRILGSGGATRTDFSLGLSKSEVHRSALKTLLLELGEKRIIALPCESTRGW